MAISSDFAEVSSATKLMSLSLEIDRVIELFKFPFMQRALLGGVLTGAMGGLLGGFAILRQLSFFSDALAHAILLGISLGVLLGSEPTAFVLPSTVVFALSVSYLLERTQLGTDALLNIIFSASLALAIIILGATEGYQGGLESLLFGDILAVRTSDLVVSGLLLVVCAGYVGLTFGTQMLLTIDESMAVARGMSISTHRTIFVVLLSLVVGTSLTGVGALLVSAFIVIPACAARLISKSFISYVTRSVGIGALSAVIGMILSARFNLQSGPSIVLVQTGIFFTAIAISKIRTISA